MVVHPGLMARLADWPVELLRKPASSVAPNGQLAYNSRGHDNGFGIKRIGQAENSFYSKFAVVVLDG